MSTLRVSGHGAWARGGASATAVAVGAPSVVVLGPRTRMLRVALAGCGVVGGSLVRLLQERGDEIAGTRGVRLQIARILVRDPARPRGLDLPPGLLTADPSVLLAEDFDVLVEAIGGLDPAERLAREALGRGRSFVTANKALVAAVGTELAALAERTGASFDFEAAVAGGVPVVRALRGSLGESGIDAIRGVLNGTTNYLLERLAQGAGYAEALAEAQARGFAEPDPARDVDGRDAAAKVAILAWLAFGADPARLPVRTRGLLPHPDLLGAAASLYGGVPRLLAECLRLPGGVAAAVEPAVVAADSELGAVRGEHNLVIVHSRWNGRIRLAGPGAGGRPTSSALLSDVLGSAGPLRRQATAPPNAPAVPHLPGPAHGPTAYVPLPPAAAPVAAPADDRALPWIVATRAPGRGAAAAGTQRALASALARAGIVARDRRRARRVAAVRTEPVSWERIAGALASSELVEAVVLRDERDGA